MAYNRRTLFDAVRVPVFGGALTQSQVDGVGKILDYRETRCPTMREDAFAYLLATVTWETGHKMQPVPEAGGEPNGKPNAYLRAKKYYPWYGRGLVQNTWEANYAKYGCANNPDGPEAMLTWPKSLDACFNGMVKGVYTGKKLDDYFTPTKMDFVGARRIINGTDRADAIAAIAKTWLEALRKASATIASPIHAGPVATAPKSPAELPAPPISIEDKPPPPGNTTAAPAPGLWSRIGAALAGAFFKRRA